MANPQLENGFTRIANEILEKMARTKLSPTQYRILFVVWRNTYGYQRKAHKMSLSYIAAATGCDKRSVQRELKKMISMNMLHETYENQTRVIGFNKYLNQWLTDGETTNGNTTNGSTTNGSTTNGELANTTIGETANSTIGETANQQIKNKENIKESSSRDELPPLMNDENLKRIAKAYKDNGFGILFPNAGQALLELADEYTIEWVELAMEKAGKMGKRNVAYVEGILKGWESEGQPNVEIGGQKEVSQPHYFKPLQYEFED